jgi:hypothetical protein
VPSPSGHLATDTYEDWHEHSPVACSQLTIDLQQLAYLRAQNRPTQVYHPEMS